MDWRGHPFLNRRLRFLHIHQQEEAELAIPALAHRDRMIRVAVEVHRQGAVSVVKQPLGPDVDVAAFDPEPGIVGGEREREEPAILEVEIRPYKGDGLAFLAYP